MKRTAKSFPVYLDYADVVDCLSDEEAGQLYKAILWYANCEELPDFEGSLAGIFTMMKNQLDRDSEKYKEKCEKNRENGKLGGRPRAQDGDDSY